MFHVEHTLLLSIKGDPMRHSFISKFTFVFIFLMLSYTLIFCALKFYIPDLGHVEIIVSPTEDNPEVCFVTLSIENPKKPYYLLVYENSKPEHWIYSSSTIYNNDLDPLIETFVPKDKSKYLIFSGDTSKKTFTFTLKSKYPINYTSNQEHIFTLYHIVPLNIFPFTFYFHKDYVFFIDPLI